MKNFVFRNRYLFLLDILLCFFAYAVVIAFVFPLSYFSSCFFGGIRQIGIVTFIYILSFHSTSIYNTDWINAGSKDYLRLISACLFANILGILSGFFVSFDVFFPKLNIAATLSVSVLLAF